MVKLGSLLIGLVAMMYCYCLASNNGPGTRRFENTIPKLYEKNPKNKKKVKQLTKEEMYYGKNVPKLPMGYHKFLFSNKIWKHLSANFPRETKRYPLSLIEDKAGLALLKALEQLEKRKKPILSFDLTNKYIHGLTIEQARELWAVKIAYVIYGEYKDFFPWSITTLEDDSLEMLLTFCVYKISMYTPISKNLHALKCSTRFIKSTYQGQEIYRTDVVYIQDPDPFFKEALVFLKEFEPKNRIEAIKKLPLYLFLHGWHHTAAVNNELKPFLDPINPFLPDTYQGSIFQSLPAVFFYKDDITKPIITLFGEKMLNVKQGGCTHTAYMMQMFFKMMGIPASAYMFRHHALYFPSESLYAQHADDFQSGDTVFRTYPIADLFFVDSKKVFIEGLTECEMAHKAAELYAQNVFDAWFNPKNVEWVIDSVDEKKEMVKRLYCVTTFGTNGLEGIFYKEGGGTMVVCEDFNYKHGEKLLYSLKNSVKCEELPEYNHTDLNKKYGKLKAHHYTCKTLNNDPYDDSNEYAAVVFNAKEPLEAYKRVCKVDDSTLYIPKCRSSMNPNGNLGSSYNTLLVLGEGYTYFDLWLTLDEVACNNGCNSNGYACNP